MSDTPSRWIAICSKIVFISVSILYNGMHYVQIIHYKGILKLSIYHVTRVCVGKLIYHSRILGLNSKSLLKVREWVLAFVRVPL